MKFFGMELAPLNVPLERRLQTAVIGLWIIIIGLGNPLFTILSFYVLFFTQTARYYLLLYFLWMFYDRRTPETGGRGSNVVKWARSLSFWRHFCRYFPLKLEKTVDLDPSRNYLFCVFPHGILSMGAFGTMVTKYGGFAEKFPGLETRLITLTEHFKVPIYREIALSVGGCSANAGSIDYLLSTKPSGEETGRAVGLVVGGASEAFESRPGSYRILLKKRKGFVRIALRHGTPLVPIIAFGETDLYNQPEAPEGSTLRKIQKRFQRLTGIAPVIVLGRGFFQYSFGLLPQRRPVTVVVGKPLELPKIEEPTTEQVAEYHEKFLKLLVELFQSEKHKYMENPNEVSLEMDI